ncbi:MAG: hypothetical protein WKF43_08910 [Acidimicrobiales bacterium]
MGLLDKAKQLASQAEAQLNSASGGQGQKHADTWLKQLGQWTYAERMGRDPRAANEIEVLVGLLQQHEAQHGPLPMPIPTPGTAPATTVASDPAPMPTPQPEPMPMPDPAPIPDPDPAPPSAAGGPPPGIPGPPSGMPGPPS